MNRTIKNFFRHLAGDTRGATALLFGLMLIPLLLAVGVGVDYARATQMRAMLQSAVDAAALSGASAYTAPSASSTATSLARSYVTKGTGALPSSVTVTSTTVTPGSSGSGNSTAYTMYVSVTATVPTTLMYPLKPSLTITASATAKNPVVTGTFDTGSFVSYACDLNQVYWYIVPPGGGVPAASAMNLLWSNDNSNPPSNVSFNVAASSQIGFAIKNVTGARPTNLGGCNYGNNGYGAQPGDTQWLYSHLQPPTLDYTTAPGGVSTGSHASGFPTNQNCTLYVVEGTQNSRSGNYDYPSVPQGNCYSSNGQNETYNSTDEDGNMTGVTCCDSTSAKMSTTLTNAAPTCAQLGGNHYQYDWNDNGGNFDTFNYGNDMQYNFSCSGGSGSGNGTSTNSVVLTN